MVIIPDKSIPEVHDLSDRLNDERPRSDGGFSIGRDGMPAPDLKPRIYVGYFGCDLYYWPTGYEK